MGVFWVTLSAHPGRSRSSPFTPRSGSELTVETTSAADSVLGRPGLEMKPRVQRESADGALKHAR